MAVTPGDLVTQHSTNFQTLFQTGYNQEVAVVEATLSPLIMDIPLDDNQGNTVQLDWLGAAPQMERWVDEKKAAGIGNNAWSARVERFHASMEVDLDAFRDARFNQYEIRLREMTQNAARLPYNLVSDLIAAGNTALCYDGQYFFDTDHSERDSGTQSNKLSGGGVATLAALKTDYYKGVSALMGFKDDKGVPMQPTNFRPLLWIPNNAGMIELFEQLQAGLLISSGETNVLANRFDLVTDPRLSGTDWFMFRRDRVMKPFIRVNREKANYRDNFTATTGDPFERRIGKASVEARLKLAYMMWQTAVMIDN